MDFASLLTLLFALTYVGVMVYVANQAEIVRAIPQGFASDVSPVGPSPIMLTVLRWMQYGVIAAIFSLGVLVLQVALVGSVSDTLNSEAALMQIDLSSAVVTFALATVSSIACYTAISSLPARQWLRAHLPESVTFNPESSVHTTAIILSLGVVIWALAAFVLQGGLSGYAESIQAENIRPGDLLFQALLQVIISLLGVGLALRRSLAGSLDRLGLRLPTSGDIVWGVGVGTFFIVVMIVFGAVWAAFSTPEQFAEQTQAVSQLNAAFATLPMAFIVAISAAVGEEIWIRGALQPVFGIGLTSIFFTLLHTQVALTPATLLIFLVSLGLGWLRQRQSTTAAIVAHFVYNFVPLALVSLGTGIV